jgi:hypothetical protein
VWFVEVVVVFFGCGGGKFGRRVEVGFWVMGMGGSLGIDRKIGGSLRKFGWWEKFGEKERKCRNKKRQVEGSVELGKSSW